MTTQPPSPYQKTPRELGFRMPAEWHPHTATWLAWPKDPETFVERVPQAEEAFLKIISALAPNEIVNLLVDDETAERAVAARFSFPGAENVRFVRLETVDSWIRDYGPNFLIDDRGRLAYNDWIFNAWGDKYDSLKHDDAIPKKLEPILGVPRFEPGIVMEGGAIDVNGAGCVLTTEQCLLNPNRNPHLSRGDIEHYLRDYLNAAKVVWLGEGIVGDDTDGHVDDIARFTDEATIVCAVEDDPADENYELLQDNLRRLSLATDAEGRPFRVVPLPMPGVVEGRDGRLPASYANFLIANAVVLAPVFNHANDARAVETLQSLFPARRVTPVPASDLVWGMGTVHCLSQQQPSA
ncbi:MAG TPA: agmatine deiminase family protein [Pyrinomonadaceae bacterium]|jgi:agmatine deiminase|nr:agmatine deiminase family protein [Pyrinomonadaceae bacterium]